MQDINSIIDSLGHSTAILDQFSASIPETELHRRRGEGFWTIAEHIDHLAAVQPMLGLRIRRFLDEDAPEFIPFIPSEEAAETEKSLMDVPTALAAFAVGRNEQVGMLTGATDSDWIKMGRHPEYTRYSLYILTRHILMHDHWHMYRMEELWLARDAFLTQLEG